MTPNIDLEVKVIKKFIDKTKQDRFIQFISTPKNRNKFIEELAHFNYLKWDLFTVVTRNIEQTIIKSLQIHKVPSELCYAISEDQDLDTQTLNTLQAIKEIIGRGNGTILVFGDANIIFYEGEGVKSRYISKWTK